MLFFGIAFSDKNGINHFLKNLWRFASTFNMRKRMSMNAIQSQAWMTISWYKVSGRPFAKENARGLTTGRRALVCKHSCVTETVADE